MDGSAPADSTLTVIGLWKDRAEPYWPDPHDFVDEQWDEGARTAVALALRSGREVRAFRGESSCRMCGRLNGSRELSDGVYLWPDGLAHYVIDHAVRLPGPVEAHFLHQTPAMPGRTTGTTAEAAVVEEDRVLGAMEADESWWLGLGSADWD